MMLVWIILGILVLLFLGFLFWVPSYVMGGKRQNEEEAMQWQSAHYDTSFYQRLVWKDYTVKGFEDYILHVQFLANPEPSTKYMILSHGYTDNHIGSLKYVPMYMRLGFHCIIYDLRGHGRNARTFATYGVREGQDLAALVEDTRKRYPDLTVLGLHGESMGAATTVTSLKYHPKVDFAVADCGFSDIENVLRRAFRNAHVPGSIFPLVNLTGKLRYHYALKEMRPIESLNENRIPVLFMHGEADGFILPKNSQDMAARTKGPKELYLISGARHAMSILTAPEEYEQHVDRFIRRL